MMLPKLSSLVCPSLLVLGLACNTQTSPEPRRTEPTRPNEKPEQPQSLPKQKSEQPVTETIEWVATRSLPAGPWYACEEGAFEVSLSQLLPALPPVDVSEQREQLRDWLWTFALARHAARSGAIAKELTFDLRPAPWVKGPLPPGGPSRAVVLDSDELVVMIPTGSEVEMKDALLRAFDRKVIDHAFTNVAVYRHGEVDDAGRAWMCKLPTLSRSRLDSAEFGLRKASIDTEEELEQALAGGLDLRSASCEDGALKVVGRRRSTTAAAPIGIEEIRELKAGSRELGPNEDLGFSLDPKRHDDKMAMKLRELEQAVLAGSLDGVLVGGGGLSKLAIHKLFVTANSETRLDFATELAEMANRAGPNLTREQAIERARLLQLVNGDFGFMDDLTRTEFGYWSVRWAETASIEQCPRYDGPVRGTTVGMVMYYTDLILKLAHLGTILGPVSVVAGPWANSPCEPFGLGYSSGRLWLEPDISDVRERSGSLSFAPEIVKLLAKQTDLATSDESEIEPPFNTQQYINRWNVASAEVYAWEPQYEHLNQIFKWNAVVLSDSTSECVDFLAAPESAELTLDQWIANQPDLRAPELATLHFLPATECLPMVFSETYSACKLYEGEEGLTVNEISGGIGSFSKSSLAQIPEFGPAERVHLPIKLSINPVKTTLTVEEGRVAATLATPRRSSVIPGETSSRVENSMARIRMLENGDAREIARVVEEGRLAAVDAHDLHALRGTLRDTIAKRADEGLEFKSLRQLQLELDIQIARKQGHAPRIQIPNHDVPLYVQNKGEAPKPGTPKPDAEYFTAVLQPNPTAEHRAEKADFEQGTASTDENHYLLVYIECEDDEQDCGEVR